MTLDEDVFHLFYCVDNLGDYTLYININIYSINHIR
jgi:hypothetical protein